MLFKNICVGSRAFYFLKIMFNHFHVSETHLLLGAIPPQRTRNHISCCRRSHQVSPCCVHFSIVQRGVIFSDGFMRRWSGVVRREKIYIYIYIYIIYFVNSMQLHTVEGWRYGGGHVLIFICKPLSSPQKMLRRGRWDIWLLTPEGQISWMGLAKNAETGSLADMILGFGHANLEDGSFAKKC